MVHWVPRHSTNRKAALSLKQGVLMHGQKWNSACGVREPESHETCKVYVKYTVAMCNLIDSRLFITVIRIRIIH
jgi:hypothetical protein